MNPKPVLALVAILTLAFPQQKAVIGQIDFFGQTGIDEARLRAALTVHTGDEITHENWEASRTKLKAALKKVAGKDPTDIATVCCDPQGGILLYIGIPGLT